MKEITLGVLLVVQSSVTVLLGAYLVYRFVRNSISAGYLMRRALGALGVMFVSLAAQNTVRALYWFGAIGASTLDAWWFVMVVGLTSLASVAFVGLFVYDVDNRS